MKIVILSDAFDDSNGPARVARLMANTFRARGHTVNVVTSVQDRAMAGKSELNGIIIWSIYSDYHLFWRPYMSIYSYQTVKNIRKILNELKPDVVHAHNIHIYLSYYTLKIAKKLGAKVFLTAHDVMAFHYGKLIEFIDASRMEIPDKFNYKIGVWQQTKRAGKTYNPFRNILIRHYLKYVDKIFAVSNALKQALNDNGINNVETIHNGINSNDWQLESADIESFKRRYNLLGKKIIFFGGRLSILKGGEKIIVAMNKIVKEFPNSVLLMVGSINAESQKILDFAGKIGIINKIITMGWLTGGDLKVAYFASDIVVMPSIAFDSFPVINLEAMAAGKPVVGTCFGGTPEAVIDNETGYIVNPYDEKELAEKIIDLLKNPAKAQAFGQAGYERVKNEFSLEKQTKKTMEWYQRMPSDKRPS